MVSISCKRIAATTGFKKTSTLTMSQSFVQVRESQSTIVVLVNLRKDISENTTFFLRKMRRNIRQGSFLEFLHGHEALKGLTTFRCKRDRPTMIGMLAQLRLNPLVSPGFCGCQSETRHQVTIVSTSSGGACKKSTQFVVSKRTFCLVPSATSCQWNPLHPY